MVDGGTHSTQYYRNSVVLPFSCVAHQFVSDVIFYWYNTNKAFHFILEVCVELEQEGSNKRVVIREYLKNLLWLRSSFGNRNPEPFAMVEIETWSFAMVSIRIATLIATLVETSVRNPGTEVLTRVSTRVSIRVAIRVAISDRNHSNFLKQRFRSGFRSGLRFGSKP